ncbi:hypothetical protein BH20ACT24_BH20ACT24_04660 [soil metagenome]
MRTDVNSAAPRIRASLTVMAVMLTLIAVGPARADTKEEIAETQRKLDEIIARIDSQSRVVAGLEDEASVLAAEISAVLSEIAFAEERIAVLHSDIQAADAFLQRLQAQVDDRASDVYQSGAGNELEILLGSTTFQDFAARLEFVNRAAESDADLFADIQNRRNQLASKKEELQAVEAGLRDQKARLARQERALSAKLAEAGSALDALNGDKAEAQSLLQELKDRHARELREAELARIAAEKRAEEARQAAASEAAREAAAAAQQAAAANSDSDPNPAPPAPDPEPAPPPPPSGGGPFQVCPVDPPRAYSNDFGVPRPGGRTHQGNDIFAPYGTPIRATFAGNAANATNETGGLAVNVFGAGGFTYNAHMSSIGQLGSVQAGDIIGYVGTSGNANGTSPHNHFEWHPGNGGAVNPYYYLNEVC